MGSGLGRGLRVRVLVGEQGEGGGHLFLRRRLRRAAHLLAQIAAEGAAQEPLSGFEVVRQPDDEANAAGGKLGRRSGREDDLAPADRNERVRRSEDLDAISTRSRREMGTRTIVRLDCCRSAAIVARRGPSSLARPAAGTSHVSRSWPSGVGSAANAFEGIRAAVAQVGAASRSLGTILARPRYDLGRGS